MIRLEIVKNNRVIARLRLDKDTSKDLLELLSRGYGIQPVLQAGATIPAKAAK